MSTKPRTWKAWAIVNDDDLMPFAVYRTRDSAQLAVYRARRTDRVIRVTITEDRR